MPKLKHLTRPKLKTWLESKPPKTVVGLRGRALKDPITNYLKVTHGTMIHTVAVGLDETIIDSVYRYEHPEWLEKLIELMDDSSQEEEITARQLLKLLEKVK